jgi:uncharacterized protein (DUF433 family)
MNWRERIESDPQTLQGKPHLRGTDIPVSVVLDELVEHKDFQRVAACHPGLSEDDVGACVAWAAECSHNMEAAAQVLSESIGPVAGENTFVDPPAPAEPTIYDFIVLGPDVGEDADFERPRRPDRELPAWDT